MLAITAVAGNVPLDLTVTNSLALVELAGREDVPVYRGAAEPMVKELVTAEYVHGPTGLDGADLTPPSLEETPGHAVDQIINIIESHSEPVTVCTLGPLTNIGMALDRAPSIAGNISEIVTMGGGFFEGGNTTPAAEFNMYVDPHAADIVFRCGAPIVLMPLDVTHDALTTTERLERFSAMGTAAGRATAGMLDYYQRWDMEKYSMPGGPLHDPTVIAYLLKPELFTGKQVNVAIETEARLTEGMTVVDWWGVLNAEPNAVVMNEIDDEGFFNLLFERIGRL